MVDNEIPFDIPTDKSLSYDSQPFILCLFVVKKNHKLIKS
jgi:hypothetical protein